VRQCYRGQTQANSRSEPDPEERYPRAAVIMPLTGNTPGMKDGLRSILNQQYPNFEVVLVTQDFKDPAMALVREVMSDRKNARHVISGPARRSSQKNHNLLAGLKVLDAAVEILVFCDSGHEAPHHWLNALIRPIVNGNAVMTTCFRRVMPGDWRLGTLAMLITVLTIHLMQSLRFMAQPWGGATAISRRVFHALNVDRVWGENVVDDVSLGARLLKKGHRVYSVPGICLNTDVTGQTIRNLMAWLTRQLLYQKYCYPGAWLAGLPVTCLLIGPLLLSALAFPGSVWGLTSWNLAATGVVYILLFTGLGLGYRTLAPQAVPLRRWIPAFYAAVLIACGSYIMTWFTDSISWRGISYRVTWGGRVREVKR